jgi:exonuclease SbcD
LAKQKLHISGTLSKELPHVTLEDEYGPVTFWLMPYVFPHLVAAVLEDDSIRDYETAVRRLLESQNIDFTKRNVLVAHQNVTQGGKEAERGGSESMVGGIDGIDYTAFDGFDYVALGHIHSAYSVGRDTVRYSGSPLCYHFDETRQKKKGPVLVELGKKGTEVSIATQTIEPLHPLREIKGDYNDIINAEKNNKTEGEYIRIVLKDRPVNPEISTNLHKMFENRHSILMELTSEYYRFSPVESLETTKDVAAKSLEELFSDFYTQLNGGIQPDESKQAVLKLAEDMVRRGEFNDQNIPSEKEVDELLDFVLKQEDENETD